MVDGAYASGAPQWLHLNLPSSYVLPHLVQYDMSLIIDRNDDDLKGLFEQTWKMLDYVIIIK